MFVEKKDIVSGRQKIGTVGSTGFSTGPHLHYEVSRYGKITNPKEYLNG
jgi:murein DD-endopeptidase MepM/ murein hydrolase activator NlpD